MIAIINILGYFTMIAGGMAFVGLLCWIGGQILYRNVNELRKAWEADNDFGKFEQFVKFHINEKHERLKKKGQIKE